MIEQELKALRAFLAHSLASDPLMHMSDIQDVLRPVLTALEKLAATPAVPDKWIDPEGDEWTFDAEQRVLRWKHGARRVVNGRVEALSAMGIWRPGNDGEAHHAFYRRMWAQFTGET